ncbi:MAG: sigma-70 family RNA polymerase sigma factor [Bacteroidota bacterium]
MTAKEFNEKVVPLNKQLYRYAFRYLENQDDSKDAVQEVFVKLWYMREELENLSSIEAFAVRVMRNYCLDRIKLKRTVSLDMADYFANRTSDDPQPDKRIEMKDSMSLIYRVIEEMPEPQRSVVRMRDLEGLDNEEIANTLQIANGTVRVILSRGRNKIREVFAKHYGYENERNKNLVTEIL